MSSKFHIFIACSCICFSIMNHSSKRWGVFEVALDLNNAMYTQLTMETSHPIFVYPSLETVLYKFPELSTDVFLPLVLLSILVITMAEKVSPYASNKELVPLSSPLLFPISFSSKELQLV